MAAVARCRFLPANGCCGGETIHLGHLTVHENEVEPAARGCLDGGPSVGCDRDATSQHLQHGGRHILVDGVILGQEDVGVDARTRGRRGFRAVGHWSGGPSERSRQAVFEQ
jgi:hypothetical protein